MTRLLAAGLVLLGSISFASAQPPFDAAAAARAAEARAAEPTVVLQRALTVLEQQRNLALNGQVNAETRALGLADEVQKLKGRVKGLEDAAAKQVPDAGAKE